MSQIDKLQAKNATLRYWLSVSVGLVLLCLGTLATEYRADKAIDEITILTILTAITGVILSGLLQHFINKNTCKLGEL